MQVGNYLTILNEFWGLCTNFTGYLNEHHENFSPESPDRYSPINLIIVNIFSILTDQDLAEGQRVHILFDRQ
jgi:hypothetical protein